MLRTSRSAAVVALAALALAGCVDSGLPGKNLPLEEARHMEWRYPAYEVAADESMLPPYLEFAGSRWQLVAMPLPEHGVVSALENYPHLLTDVGGSGPAALRALATDAEPYHRLYTTGPDGVRIYERVY